MNEREQLVLQNTPFSTDCAYTHLTHNSGKMEQVHETSGSLFALYDIFVRCKRNIEEEEAAAEAKVRSMLPEDAPHPSLYGIQPPNPEVLIYVQASGAAEVCDMWEGWRGRGGMGRKPVAHIHSVAHVLPQALGVHTCTCACTTEHRVCVCV